MNRIIQNFFGRHAAWGLLILLPAFLVVGGCSTNPATGKQSFTAFMSPEREREVGREEHPKVVAQFGGVYEDDKLSAYVKRIGNGLAVHSEMPDLNYTFTILNDPAVNAFALPGGYVYVTRGLMALANSEAELAGVLAHEIGHITARHTAQRYSEAMAANIGLQVLGAIGKLPTGVGELATFGAEAVLKSHSREQELESDMLGVRYISRAGYSPHAMTSFFRKLQANDSLEAAIAGEQNGAGHAGIMSTHPRTENRIEQAITLAAETPSASTPVAHNDYLQRIEFLVYGDHPEHGLRIGRKFVHPALRFAFEVPKGFVLFNMSDEVVAKHPSGAAIAFDMATPEKINDGISMQNYLQRVWASSTSLRGVETIDINGMEAATGRGRIRTQSGIRDIRLVAIRAAREQVYRFLFLTPPGETEAMSVDLRRTTYSFRRLSQDEAAAVTPARIRLHRVKAGETVADLSQRMEVDHYPQRTFRALNGLGENDELTVGQWVKLVRR